MTSEPTIETIRLALGRVYDPEFGASVEDLGLIYAIRVEEGCAFVAMTLTSMYCPAGDVILSGVKAAVEAVPGIASAYVELVWTPAWSPELLSIKAREQLGWNEPELRR